ncbi:ATP-binding protein [Mycolicibacterium sp.]|uniref:ATP-binding protein n=1 Tax=Mycolicibacterium sp. TaxID=2320850 RepID=UPI003568591B
MADDADKPRRARVYADVRDFPIYLSHIDDNTRLWFAPWRIWDGATFLVGSAATVWATRHWLESGHAVAVFLFGAAITAGLTVLARQVPVSRPSPFYRIMWLLEGLVRNGHTAAVDGRRDAWLSPPEEVIDNLIFTPGGVYAEFIVDGQPGGMMSYALKDAVSRGHRPLVRQLPSGMLLWGANVRINPRQLLRRMLSGYERYPNWIQEVRDWEHFVQIEPFYEQVFGLRIPVDAGMEGRSGVGGLAKMATVVAGRDPDDPQSLAGYREMVDKLLTKIPRQFNARPATPRQIHWWYRRRWSLGALSEPFPHEPGGPDRLTSTDFASLMPADFDGGDQMSRRDHRSWWRRLLPSLAPLLVIRRPKQPASYQSMLAVAQLPRAGLVYPRAEYLLSLYDVEVDSEVEVDWFQHVSTRSAERALNQIDRAQRNLDDQAFQRGSARASNSDLAERYAAGEEYNAKLRASKLEREVSAATVVAVGAATRDALDRAAHQLQTHFAEELDTTLSRWRGSAQVALWQTGIPGSEERSPRSQFDQPTTTTEWARFSPLVSNELGNDTGILFARNMATRRPSPVLLDPEGVAHRRGAPGVLFFGPPGGGKSQGAKRIVTELLARNSQCSIVDPGTNREWEPALAHLGDRVVYINPTRGDVSMDGLRIFRREIAVERTLDHLLPMMGVEPDAEVARQLRFLLRPDQRVAESLGALVRYLNSLRGQQAREYADLTAKLDMWANIDYLRAMFDESLPVPPIAERDAVVWLTSELELPTTAQTEDLHQYRRQSARARAGFAIYGMIAALTREAYTGPHRRPGGFGWFVAEEARTYFSSPVGQEDAVRLITQGRKERYGLIAISQHVEHFHGIPTKDLPSRIITPFKPIERDQARTEFKAIGIDPDEYPEVLDLRTVEGHGYAYLIDEFGRAGLVDMLPPVQQERVQAFDTRGLDDTAGAHLPC